MRNATIRSIVMRTGVASGLLLAGVYGCGSEAPDDEGGDGSGAFGNDGNDGNDSGSGGFGFPQDGPNDGQGPTGNPQYQPNFIERGRPPGPPERGYTAVEADLSGSGEGELCALCADSADCAEGACVVHMDTGETFCGTECETVLDCADPQTQECVDVEDGPSQCVPRLGTCYEFDPSAEPINPINEPPEDNGNGEGGSAGSGG